MRPVLTALLCAVAIGCTSEKKKTTSTRIVGKDYRDNKLVTEAELKESIEKNPDDPSPYFLLGQHYEEINQTVLALEYFLKGLEKFPAGEKLTGGHYRVGRAYATLKRPREAIIHLSLVIALEPKDLAVAAQNHHFQNSHYHLGISYKELLDYERARYHFKRFLDLGGDQEEIITELNEIDQELKGMREDIPSESDQKRR